MEDEVASVLIGAPARPLVVRVSRDGGDGFLRDGGDVPGLDEDQEGGLGVSPDEVGQELVEGVGDGLGALPDLALADEDVAVVDAYEDVGLAGAVEDLAADVAFELGVQADEQSESRTIIE